MDGTEIIPIRLSNGTIIRAEVSSIGIEQPRERDVAGTPSPTPKEFEAILGAIEGIARSVNNALERIRPREAVVEFGLELAVESGSLTALLVKGTGKGTLKVSLKWVTEVVPPAPSSSSEATKTPDPT
jgi:hypothetical protein